MLPIFDDHLHLSPTGRRLDAVRLFLKAGGTHLLISHMPYGLRPIRSSSDWREEFEVTCDFAERANRETDARAYCVVGPYPVDLLELEEILGPEEAFDLMIAGVDVAADLVQEGKAVGIGEVGRPHFEVDEERWRRSNDIMRHCMKRAGEIGCPVVLHTEHATADNLTEFSEMAVGSGLVPERVIKHYCGRLDPSWHTGGLTFSVLSIQENVVSAIEQQLPFMMETDYLDDMSRPGAVLSPATVPKRTHELFEEGIMDEELWNRVHVETPRRAYGIEIEL